MDVVIFLCAVVAGFCAVSFAVNAFLYRTPRIVLKPFDSGNGGFVAAAPGERHTSCTDGKVQGLA